MIGRKLGRTTLRETLPEHIQRKVPHLLRRLESVLYINAPSKEAYLDKTTLKDRLRWVLSYQEHNQVRRKRVTTE